VNIEIGKAYNNWTVIAASQTKGKFECKCKCGTRREVIKGNLGKVKGCGCDRKKYERSGKWVEQYAKRIASAKPVHSLSATKRLDIQNPKPITPPVTAQKFVITSSRHTSSTHVIDADERRVRAKRAENEQAQITKLELADENDYFNEMFKDLV
jgi:hypothetical protein